MGAVRTSSGTSSASVVRGRKPGRNQDRSSRPLSASRTCESRVNRDSIEAEIRARLRLQAGEPFDFYRWQQDRDRLQRFYRERSFWRREFRLGESAGAGAGAAASFSSTKSTGARRRG